MTSAVRRQDLARERSERWPTRSLPMAGRPRSIGRGDWFEVVKEVETGWNRKDPLLRFTAVERGDHRVSNPPAPKVPRRF